MSEPVTYTVGEQKDYIGAFFATEIIALLQTMIPVLVGQLW